MSKQKKDTISQLQAQTRAARAAILSMTTLSGSGHPGGSMSAIDILACIYHSMRFDPQNPQWEERDRVIVSNGHISPAVYSILGLNGFFPLDEAISQFRLTGSRYEGHIEREVPGVEWTTGNLGQGLSAAVGMALAAQIKGQNHYVYALMGDGEQQKGQIGEARRLAVKYRLNRLIAIVDYNRLQISGQIHDVMPQNIRKNWESDGWTVMEVNGHDFDQILQTLEQARQKDNPVMILARTVMGKGVDFMEDQAKYHGATLREEQLAEALAQLEEPNRFAEYQKMRQDAKVRGAENTSIFALKASFDRGQTKVYEYVTDNRSAWGNAISDLGEINKDNPTPIVVLDCDLASSVKTDDFARRLPDRFIQAGIMEHNTAVVAGAISSCGIQTFWAGFGMFGIAEVYNMQRLNDINWTNLKVVLTHVGLDVGADGKTHQSIDYISLSRNLHNFRLILPADPNQTDRIIRWLIDKPGNYIIAMGRSRIPIIKTEEGAVFYDANYDFNYGKADVLRKGDQGCVLVTGTPVANTITAVDALREQGINPQLYYVSSPLQLDDELLAKVAASKYVVTIEDHHVQGGLGTTLADRLLEKGLFAQLLKIGVKGYPHSGPSDELYALEGLDAASLQASISGWFSKLK
ncbi:MAG: transketolase [Candidatus Cloacimonetes bacterium]|nr:transketolase [Candidatus Cloacimonadota bacterium]